MSWSAPPEAQRRLLKRFLLHLARLQPAKPDEARLRFLGPDGEALPVVSVP
jgi:hypothetical protein